MRHAWLLVLAACQAPRERAPTPAIPADAPVAAVTVADAPTPAPTPAPARHYRDDDGWDFRTVALDPTTIGSEQLCVVDYVGAKATEGGAELACAARHATSTIALAAPARAVAGLAPRDVVQVRVDAAGDGNLVARATLIEKVGALDPPPPPDRCDCHDRDRDHQPHRDPRPTGYDFDHVFKDRTWGKPEMCEVVVVDRPMRTGAGAPEYSAGAQFDDPALPYAVQVYCQHSSEPVDVATYTLWEVLALRPGQLVELTPDWTGHNEITAILDRIVRDVGE